MPAMANITVLNAAAANVIYVAATPSAGDKVPARWTANAISGIPGFRPRFEMVTRDNANKNARIAEGSFSFPILETVSGVVTKTATVPLNWHVTLPTNVDAALVNDAFVQAGNLLVSALIRASASEGYAPT